MCEAPDKELKGFYAHLGVYVVFNLGLFLINWIVSAKVRRLLSPAW